MNTLSQYGVSKQDFTSADRNIVKRAKYYAIQTCRFKISEQYIKRAFNTFKRGVLYEQNETIIGFCIWKEKNKNDETPKRMGYTQPDEKYMEILLLCTIQNEMKLGTHILREIDVYCIQNSIRFIALEPIDDITAEFYRKCGYIMEPKSYLSNKNIMIKPIETYKIQAEPRGKTRRLRKRAMSLDEASRATSQTNRIFTPEEARQMMNYNLDLTNVGAQQSL